MNSCNLILFISELACTIAKCYDTDDATLLAAIFTQLGDSITTILANNDITTTDNSQDFENYY